MSFDPSSFIVLDAKSTFRGATHNHTGELKDLLKRESERFTLGSGREIAFANNLGREITIPVVAPMSELVNLFQFVSGLRYGQAIAPHAFAVSALNLTTNVLTVTAHPFATADAVTVRWEETPPTSAPQVARGTICYVHRLSADTFTLHASADDATGNVTPVDFTVASIGGFWVCAQFPITIHRRSGVKRIYSNVAPIKLPTLTLNGGKRFFSGDLVLHAYPQLGKGTADADAFGPAETPAAYTPPDWNADAVLCARNLTIAWGGDAPWNDLECEMGVELSVELQLEAKGNGLWPHITDVLKGCKVTAKLLPIGISVAQFDAVMAELLGQQLSSRTLTIYDGTYTYTLTGAVVAAPEAKIYSADKGVVPQLTFEALGSAATDNQPPFTIA